MKRLTQWTSNGASLILANPETIEEAKEQVIEKSMMAWNLLASYEDTGLTPEECAEFVHEGMPVALDKLAAYESTGLQPEEVLILAGIKYIAQRLTDDEQKIIDKVLMDAQLRERAENEAVIEAAGVIEDMRDVGASRLRNEAQSPDDRKAIYIGYSDLSALNFAIEALRAMQERENPEPLIYEEYSSLEESTPVWVVDGDKQETWALVNNDGDCIDSGTGLWEQTYYGLKGDGHLGLHSVGWLAYRSRPEEGAI